MKEGSTFKRLSYGAIFIFVGNIIGSGASFLTRIASARYLGPGDYGLIILGITSLNLMSLATLFGLPQGLARQLPRSDNRSALFSIVLSITIPLTVIISVLLIIFSGDISNFLNEPGFGQVFVVFASALPLIAFMRLSISALRGLEDAKGRVLVQNMFRQGGTAVAVFVGILLGARTVEIASSWVIGIGLAVLISTVRLSSHGLLLSNYYFRFSDVPDYGKPILLFSLPLLLSQGMWALVQQADNYIIAYFVNSGAVGIYDATFTFGRILLRFIWSFEFIFLPAFAKLHKEGKLEEMDRTYKMATKWMVFLGLPLYLTFIFYPKYILQLTFGPRFIEGDIALVVVATGFFTHVILGTNSDALIAIGRNKSVMYGNGIALVFNIFLNLALVPVAGITGA
ncbi:MAG: flippase, partial [Halobacteriaceae archaeon]